MGIFSVFSRNKKEPEAAVATAPDSIYYADVPGWLESVFSDRMKAINEKTSKACECIMAKKGGLKEKIDSLGSQRFDPQDRMYARVNMAKDTFVNKALAELNKIGRPETFDYGKLSEFSDDVVSALESIKKATPKQAILISNYFKKQSNEMVTAIKEMDAASSGLKQLLDRDCLILKAVREAKDAIARISELETEYRIDQINLSKVSVDEASIGGKILARQRELEALTASDEWKGYAESLNGLSITESKLKSVEQDANNTLSALRRPMKKLSHDRKLAGLPENPFREVVLAGRSTESMARSVLDASAAGEIALKSSEREKIMALSDSRMAELRDSYNHLTEERDALEKSVDAALMEKKKSTEAIIAGLKEDGQRARRDVEFLEEKNRRNNEEKKEKLGETGRAVQAAVGKEINITLQKNTGKP